MNNTNIKQLALTCGLLLGSSAFALQAQESGEVNLGFQVKTNHLWHGFIVTPGVFTAGELTYTTASGNTKFGLWGGASFDGSYKELTYFASHKFSDNLFVEIVTHGNHSGIYDSEDGVVDIFNFGDDPAETGNFTDIGVGYTFAGDAPVSIYYSVIVQGIDVFEDEETGERERAYTNYLEVSKPVWSNTAGESVNAFIGGAFSPKGDQNFYYKEAGIVNVGFTYNTSVSIGEFTLPVSSTAMWNPSRNEGALQVALNFF